MANRPQTLYGLMDSPIGLAAWILDHDKDSYEMIAPAFFGHPGGLSRDDVLDNITMYWLTKTAISSARLYWENKLGFFNVEGVTIPVGVSAFPHEIYTAPQSWSEKAYPKLVYYKKHDVGGHFAAWEQPQLFSRRRSRDVPIRQELMMKRLSIFTLSLFLVLSTTFSVQAVTPVRNIVLVHGAFADGSSWSKVISLLQAKGYSVIAVQNPLSSLRDDVAATKRAIAQMNGPVILVGHSWAGMVVSQAGNDPKVAGLVFISALVPKKGQSAGNATQGYPAAPGTAQIKADAAGYLSLTRKGVDEDFVPELPAVQREICMQRRGRGSLALYRRRLPTRHGSRSVRG